MKRPPKPDNEAERLALLQELRILDTPPEREFDEITQLAAMICEAPVALISLIDDCRQWFKAKVGMDGVETDRDVAFCAYAILQNKALIVPDALLDDRFKANPYVLGPPYVRFYTGVPLITQGLKLGTLCLVDYKPRTLTKIQLEALHILARQTARLLDFRLAVQSLDNANHALTIQTQELRSLSEQHRLILDNIPALVAYWGADQRCRFANSAYLDWFGFKDPVGKSMTELFGPILYEKSRTYIEQALQGKRQVFQRELFHVRLQESRHTNTYYIPDIEDGVTRGFYVLVFDVSEMKALEHAASQLAEKAIAASKAKSEFLANMSHEIRTPMNSVLGLASVLLETSLNPEQKEYVSIIQKSSRLLLDIINGILDFSKIEAGKMELNEADFDFKSLIKECIDANSVIGKEKGLKLIENVPLCPVGVRGDSGRIRQVVTNLVSNAIKFTHQGSVVVSLRQISRKSHFRLLVEVKDSGIGISDESRAKLFAPFTQADGMITKKYGGSGLGLSISRRLIELMGGRIGVRSEIGKGSSFWFCLRLPKSHEQLASCDSSSHSEALPFFQNQKSVLVVDDIAANCLVAVAMLKKLGIRAVAVTGGLAALERIQKEKFDLILMDCRMPDMDGFETTQRIRQLSDPTLKNLPVIALTANAFPEEEKACLQSGMNGFISKPIEFKALVRVLSQWMNKRT